MLTRRQREQRQARIAALERARFPAPNSNQPPLDAERLAEVTVMLLGMGAFDLTTTYPTGSKQAQWQAAARALGVTPERSQKGESDGSTEQAAS